MSETVRVVVDAMGGDNAPGEIVKGAVQAVQAENDIKVFLAGRAPFGPGHFQIKGAKSS